MTTANGHETTRRAALVALAAVLPATAASLQPIIVEADDDQIAAKIEDKSTKTRTALDAASVQVVRDNTGTVYAFNEGVRPENGDNSAEMATALAKTPPGGTLALAPGKIALSQTTLIDKPLNFDCGASGYGIGATGIGAQLVYPVGVTGIIINQAGNIKGGARIGPIELVSTATAAGVGHGIVVENGQVTIDRATASRFAGHGFVFNAGSGSGGGNVNHTFVEQTRAYGNFGDGYRFEGSSAQAILVVKPSAIANRGWGLNNDSSNTVRVFAPHFDQAYGGSPGALRDNSNSSSYLEVYAESGGNGSIALLDIDSVAAHISFGQYGALSVTDNSRGRTAVVEDRTKGTYYRHRVVGRHGTRFETDVDELSEDLVRLGHRSATGTFTEVARLSGTSMQFGVNLLPTGNEQRDFGTISNSWRRGYFTTMHPQRYTTAKRPTPSAAGNRAVIIDDTLGKILWSNGATWRDAMGNIV